MARTRKIKKIFSSKPTIEGAGVHLKRAFGFSEVPQFDPFLLLDDFHSDQPEYYLQGFPWHPHRGIETITYVLQGEVEHGDSMGNKGMIYPGEVQWMTAGSGIIHQEMPRGNKAGVLQGLQLWANLPAAYKMMDPRYRDVKNEQIPEITLDNNITVRIICGELNGHNGPVRDIVIEPEYLDIAMRPNCEFRHRVPDGHTVFAYIIQGRGYFCSEGNPYAYDAEGANYFELERPPFMSSGHVVHYENSGDEILVTTKEEAIRFLLISGKPIGEPVAWYGPIVMNSREELQVAFNEYRKGTFIKHK